MEKYRAVLYNASLKYKRFSYIFMHFGFRYFSSEAVLPGHPDKIADRISDLVLDTYLQKDPSSRVAAETMVTPDRVIVAGEIYGPEITNAELEEKIRLFLKSVGYEKHLLDWESLEIVNLLHEQSPEISAGLRRSAKLGAGDQGIMFGYATDETPVGMPAPVYYVREIIRAIGENPLFGPDGKSQITVEYDFSGRPVGVTNVVASVQHPVGMSTQDVRNMLLEKIISVLPKDWSFSADSVIINPAGAFTIGGPKGDCGLTGRKIVADTYGGVIPNGGGAFSGKDATKVDRSAAYLARYIAKNIVFSGVASKCVVQLCYAIGMDAPLNVQISTPGTTACDEEIFSLIGDKIDFSPLGISALLHLDRPIYLKTSTMGHFGHSYSPMDMSFKWEDLDLVPAIQERLKEVKERVS
ncbi:methionine adenosyltransferase [Neorickettsia risticii str. Illinois]|uniref:Methionine adenosyltransferase n=1 Tax=Neorickettsia risticii (strain Illinois) TaxID=434131 RepID=C6V4X6_NEORI|nr:methionine adenosyltransferase [Neorickettsia risticii]ACT69442.1 methionine adenosyltransferase [Neorickettsia risticii str. Illinois]